MTGQTERRTDPLYTNGRRLSDDFHTRLTVVENSIIILEQEISEHKGRTEAMTRRMCDTLDDIKLEISGAKGFLKAVVVAGAFFAVTVAALYAVQWLKVPV